jgi:hypothetical protein
MTGKKLHHGGLSKRQYVFAAVLLRASRNTLHALARANCFDVIGGVSQGEIELLEPVAAGDRAYLVQTWMVRLMTNRLAAGGLAIPPPLLSRTYQVLSDGTAAAVQARKVSYVVFPFPLRQLLLLLLWVFIVIAPMCIAAFIGEEVLVGLLSFFVCLGYTALNETAAELEHPFGLGANHLNLTAYQKQFNSKLSRLFDQTIPQLGYQPGLKAEGTSAHCYAHRRGSSDGTAQESSPPQRSAGPPRPEQHTSSAPTTLPKPSTAARPTRPSRPSSGSTTSQRGVSFLDTVKDTLMSHEPRKCHSA